MKKSVYSFALALAAGAPVVAHAQSTLVTELDPIIVSAGISPVSADAYGRSHTVISRQEIEAQGYTTVQEALEARPGVSINGTGPNDRQIRIRGGESSHTLVLIDGVRAAAGDNEFFLRGLDLSAVERIEILRGPQSVPFGTDAATGVINVITREAAEGLNAGGSAEVGEGDRQSAYVTYGGASHRLALSVSNLNDRGFDFSGSGGERDGTRWQSATAKGSVDLTPATTLGFSFRLADADYDFDDTDFNATRIEDYVVDSVENERNLTERAGSVFVEHRPANQSMSHRLRLDRTANQTDNAFASDSTTDVVNYRFQIALDQARIESSDQLLSVLLERRTDGDEGEVPDRENDSAALEYRTWLSEQMSVQAGVRYDDNNVFDNATTWNVASSYFLENDIRFHASAGRAVVNPTFFEFTGGTDQALNADLQPEKNEGFDVGVELPVIGLNGSVDVTYFQETLTDEIFTTSGFTSPFIFENRIGESDREGVEITAIIRPANAVDLRVNYTYLDAADSDGNTVIRRPRNELGMGATWRLPNGDTTLSGNLRHVRGLYDDEFFIGGQTGVRLDDFTVAGFALTHSLNSTFELTARLTNAFDETYQEVAGFATRGQAAYVGVRAAW
ncbi:MAG: TonB-dependent receptor [Gammaproteobacteria bacterium]|nr:TonB-dependent receptor [Gammaproteobacteria bacterium]